MSRHARISSYQFHVLQTLHFHGRCVWRSLEDLRAEGVQLRSLEVLESKALVVSRRRGRGDYIHEFKLTPYGDQIRQMHQELLTWRWQPNKELR